MAASRKRNVNPDLAKERSKATFDVEELTYALYLGKEMTERKRYLEDLAINDPFIKGCKPWAFCSREEQYEMALKKHIYIAKRIKELGLTTDWDQFFYTEAMACHENSPIGLHSSMFLPTLRKQGSEEQKKKFLPLAENMTIIGTYAQTELGHGTFIRGLETTATYDPKSQEFILHSPTLTSMKYWPGNLGKTVNFCIIMAQLYTKGQCHGIHTFLLPLRDLETHKSLPGVELGDIGPKFGYGTNDNGYLRLSNVRIPLDHMLMRYSKVLKDGTYVKPPNTRLSYGSMTLIRAIIVGDSSRGLSQACTIALRYSAVRRQTEISPGGPEAQIIDYQTQQHKLFPLLATAYALHFTGQNVYMIYMQVTSQIEEGNLDQIGELHALSAGLKAFSTWECTKGIEVCRMACGGHGYSHASGLPKIYVDLTPGCTYEGENTVMMLQTARYLMKCYAKVESGEKLPGFVSYLNTDLSAKSCLTADVTLDCLLQAYEHRATRMVHVAAKNMNRRVMVEGQSQQQAWNNTSQQLVWASRAHCHTYVVRTFVDMVTSGVYDNQVQEVLTSLCKLYAVHGIVEYLGEFIQDGYFSTKQVDIVTDKLWSLMQEIRPNAVALVDAFDYPDAVLDSCLGRYDGNVYQALYEYAKSSPLNQKDVLDTYEKYVKPMRGDNFSSAELLKISKL
ncbi:peroxisomal acyl-coenzyme A oxidase 1-like [Ylistrum balloti]|uniref:peroxisomal acyl-coenzyme A oxidase 1-like n=1 Tax=Ylistrum balloti TaxID=509963 RepID=UPI002905D274|nr:peroxisomal acyl-coenzyme A oxidase 1-like [Ylistrum balloti]